MKKLTVLACAYMLTMNLSFGQEKVKTIESKRRTVLVNEESTQTSAATHPATESAYFGYDQKIAAIMIANEVPANCPTKQSHPSKQEYLTVLNKWIKENPSLVKPEHKNSQITDK